MQNTLSRNNELEFSGIYEAYRTSLHEFWFFFFVEKHNSADDPARVDEKFMRIIKLVPTRAHPELRKHQTIVETFQMRL